MRRILSILLENEPGALSRIVGLFSQRGYNIETLTVAPTEDSSLSRITITTIGDDKVIEQITKQVNKLVDVLKVTDLTDGEHIERELMLVKLRAATAKVRDEIKRTADIFRGQIVDVTPQTYVVQLIGTSEKLDAFIEAASSETEVIETSRSGVTGLARGEKALRI
jgi:acetolactate synthase-1/3 small subunit